MPKIDSYMEFGEGERRFGDQITEAGCIPEGLHVHSIWNSFKAYRKWGWMLTKAE